MEEANRLPTPGPSSCPESGESPKSRALELRGVIRDALGSPEICVGLKPTTHPAANPSVAGHCP
jgi:hypothetical protein